MQLKINTSAEAVKESSGSNYISTSGIYPVTIKFASVDVSKNGAESVNFNIEYKGNSQTIYGPYVTSKAGDPLEIGLKLINKLGIVAGMTGDDSLTIEQEEHIVGKDNKQMTFDVIQEFSDLECYIRIQEEYSKTDKGDIRKALVPRTFYRHDKATAEEIVNGTEVGVQMTKDEAYASNVTYKDGLTAEDVAAWAEAKKTGGSTPAPKPTAAKKPAGSLFK